MNSGIFTLAVYVLIASVTTSQAPPTASPTIVFVCEHGAAKSVIATAYFNKLAAERGLPYRATFRGTSPQAELSERTIQALRADGIAVPLGKPTAIDQADIESATHIFAIGCALPDAVRKTGKARDWSDVPEDRGYDATRDAILKHVRELLDELSHARQDLNLRPPAHSLPSARPTSTCRSSPSIVTRTVQGLQQTSQSCTNAPSTSGSRYSSTRSPQYGHVTRSVSFTEPRL
jgi:arsenate reductase